MRRSQRRAGTNVGICGRDGAVSLNYHLLSFILRLKLGSKLEQLWLRKAEMLLRRSANRNGGAGAACRGKHKMLYGKTFSGGIKAPLGLKCRVLTRGEKRKQEKVN